MPAGMKAMVLREFGSPLHLDEVAKPVPSAGEVVVRVRACGVCYTDVKVLNGMLGAVTLPRIPGHEPAGEVSELGEGVGHVAVGDRVAVHFYVPCKACFFCRKGLETSCESLVAQLGFTADGAYAQYVKVPAENVARLDDAIPFEEGAVVADAIATTVQGLRDRVGVQMGETVLIVGAGGLGLHAIQVARLGGANVIAVDRATEKLELARKVGADVTIDAVTEDAETRVMAETGMRGVDVAVDLVGSQSAGQTCFRSLRSGGRMLVLGYRPGVDLPVPATDLVAKQLSIIGSRAASIQTFKETVKLVNDGRIKPIVTRRFPLEEANAALEHLQGNDVLGRGVLVMEPDDTEDCPSD